LDGRASGSSMEAHRGILTHRDRFEPSVSISGLWSIVLIQSKHEFFASMSERFFVLFASSRLRPASCTVRDVIKTPIWTIVGKSKQSHSHWNCGIRGHCFTFFSSQRGGGVRGLSSHRELCEGWRIKVDASHNIVRSRCLLLRT
jgi:hypothetical protein